MHEYRGADLNDTSEDQRKKSDDLASELRHHLRNRLAAIRNAAFYIKKKAEREGLTEKDPRVARFFDLIQDELTDADESISARLTIEHLLGDEPAK
jgi:signal transduction histidine kinase